jgi:outer membrane lipoprotein-sorting protein
MTLKNIIYKLFLVVVLTPLIATAQTAAEWTAKLEELYKSSTAVEITFTSEGKNFSMTLGPTTGSYKLITPTEQFICDGKTVWHVFTKEKKVVIDSAKKSTINAQSLLDFTHNYSSLKEGNALTFFPNANVSSIFANAGNVNSITFNIDPTAKTFKIKSIVANSSRGDLKMLNVKIKPIKKAPKFAYKPTKGIKVTDLR